jgi:hypothetical protein
VGQLLNLATGALLYAIFAGVGGLFGYYFARKRTEHEVGYQRRVAVVERIQSLVVSLSEEFEAALAYVREPDSAGDLPVKKVESGVDELERYYVQQEIWLDGETLARLDALTAESRARLGELELLPRLYGDPNFERAYHRAGIGLEAWLRAGLPEAREALTDSFRTMLGVGGRRHYGLTRRASTS